MEKHKQTWWDKDIKTQFESFKSWVGTKDAYSKKYARRQIISSGHKSIVDVGCGNATEYFAYKEEAPEIEYLGVDGSEYLYEYNLKRGVPIRCAEADDTKLPMSSYDVAFSRHVLEHQSDFKPVLDELIRIGRKEAWHIFFIIPRDKEIINYDEKQNLYHNTYNRNEVMEYALANPKVKTAYWQPVSEIEEILICELVK
jgi:ubiquinone/menaquinone biosynthesis C-methylase UbiE